MPVSSEISAAPVPRLQREFELPDAAATDALGARCADAIAAWRKFAGTQSLHTGLQLQLWGDLGAGKTAFARALLRRLGYLGRVRSQTYTLVEPYTISGADGAFEIYHFDLYRFADPAEWFDAGFDEYLCSADALCLIEWPQRAAAALGVPDLALTLEMAGDGRRMIARAFS